ncbi:IPT/TIG domain-containing protein [Homoserinimonas aerilata]|uniref:IPT/TIG domain-containing protein n=1 Tax=Homoserinimonas aerilata TaxID=1162970 RepID=A0A542YF26_9MICO|nr:IPT/TIG domain-containing protein [Homoserinimonas aerilata]TQL46671.1 IPT/TIG domain-containing protein [Homoserinimonas aerilata]
MADQTLYDTTTPSVGSVALAHQKILRMKLAGAFINCTGDINNLAGNPAPIIVQREVYGTKGRTSQDIIGYNFAPTFSVEGVRDPITKKIVAAQAWVIDLLNAAYSEGELNKREFQWFDALDEDLPAFEGKFSVAVADLNTGYADKGGWTFTLTNDGVVERIVSPIAGAGIPIIESVGPAGQTVGDQVVIRGYGFTGTTAVTIDTITVAEYVVVDANTIVAVIPAAVAGPAPVIVTNAGGASTAFNYTAAA